MKNYFSYLNIKYKYSFLLNDKKIRPILGLLGGLNYFQCNFSTTANCYQLKNYPINDITLSIPIGVLTGFELKVSNNLSLEFSIPYNILLLNFNVLNNKNPTITLKERHVRSFNTELFEHKYSFRIGLKMIL